MANKMTKAQEESIIEGLQEEKEATEIAKDYRQMSATEFFKKYLKEDGFGTIVPKRLNTSFYDLLALIDQGIETNDWIR
jgi:hypothetical protein